MAVNDKILTKNSKKIGSVKDYLVINSFLVKAPLSIAIFNQQGDFIYRNPAFKQLFKKIEKNNFNLIRLFDGDEEKLLRLRQLFRLEKELYTDEHAINNELGQEFWVKLTAFISYQEKEDKLFVLIANDITREKRSEKQARKNENLLSALNENITEALFQLKNDEGFVYVNKAFLNLFQYECINDFHKLKFHRLFEEEHQGLKQEKKLHETGYLKNQVNLYKKVGGHSFWGLTNITSKNYNEHIFYNGTIVDVSATKEKEDLLEAKNNELEYTHEQLDRILYSASHDLKSPLTSMQGLLHLMETEFSGVDQLEDYIQKLTNCTKKLDLVISGLNNYTQSTRKRAVFEKIDVGRVIQKAINKCKALNNFKEVNISIDHKAHLPFYNDTDSLHLIIKSVLENSIQYCDTSKSIRFVTISTQQTTRKLTLEIVDNGIGIAKPYREKVFGMFYKATSASKGAGLGLYVAKETLRKLGGSITMDSTYQKGTVVHIEIPNGAKGRLMAEKLLLKGGRDE